MHRPKLRITTRHYCAALAFLAAAASISQSHAASIGLVGAATVSQRSSTVLGVTGTTDGLLGYGGGLLLGFRLAPAFSIDTGALYLTRSIGFTSEYTETSNWIQVPVLAKVNFLGISLGAGGYAAYAIGKVKTSLFGFTSELPVAESDIKAFDVGAMGSLGYTFLGTIMTEARYSVGLNNIARDSLKTSKHNDIQLLFGVRF